MEGKAIIKWVRNNGIFPMNCGCTVAAEKTSSKRRETKELIAQLVKNNPDIKKRIIQSTQNVNLEKNIRLERFKRKILVFGQILRRKAEKYGK